MSGKDYQVLKILLIEADVQPKKYRPSALWRRIGDSNAKHAYIVPHFHPSPIFRPVSPSRIDGPVKPSGNLEDLGVRDGQSTDPSSHDPLQPLFVATVGDPLKVNDSRPRTREPRSFHLAKVTSKASSLQLSPSRGIKKQSKRKVDNVAVFVERHKRTNPAHQDWLLLECIQKDSSTAADSQSIEAKSATPRKRPNVGAAERLRKERTRVDYAYRGDSNIDRLEHSAKKLPNRWDDNSEMLAARLQQVVLDELNDGGTWPYAENRLKFKPKPPKPREQKANSDNGGVSQDTEMADEDRGGNESDYVYDTYVKTDSSEQDGNPRIELMMDPLSKLDGDRVGMLIIEDEEEALWETFGKGGESDSEPNSEENDENG